MSKNPTSPVFSGAVELSVRTLIFTCSSLQMMQVREVRFSSCYESSPPSARAVSGLVSAGDSSHLKSSRISERKVQTNQEKKKSYAVPTFPDICHGPRASERLCECETPGGELGF